MAKDYDIQSAASKRDPFAPRTEAQKGKVVLGPERPAAITHGVQACYDNGESWNLVCDCQWECWEQPDEGTARRLHARHVVDEGSPAANVNQSVERERKLEAALQAIIKQASPREWETSGHPMNEWTKREPILRIANEALS